MSDATIMSTPMEHTSNSITDDSEERSHEVPYRTTIGSFMHLMICTCPDIGLAVGKLSISVKTPSSAMKKPPNASTAIPTHFSSMVSFLDVVASDTQPFTVRENTIRVILTVSPSSKNPLLSPNVQVAWPQKLIKGLSCSQLGDTVRYMVF